LEEAVASVVKQDWRPLEILVGDDSPSNEAEQMLKRFQGLESVNIRYLWNRPGLGQAGNVNRLFAEASGDRLLLLHDDDLLVEGAISKLAAAWDPDLSAVFGKQYIISDGGQVQKEQSEDLNEYFYRTPQYEGEKLSALEAALLAQFPNDGYLVRRQDALRAPYQESGAVGQFCDYYFGLQLASLPGARFRFVNDFTASYRMTAEAVSRNLRPGETFSLVEKLPIPPACEWARRVALERLAPVAIAGCLKEGASGEALRIYLTPHYAWKRRLSPGGLKKLAQIGWTLVSN
jgi:glycosyltransferase involved in cell wall biosynthesis